MSKLTTRLSAAYKALIQPNQVSTVVKLPVVKASSGIPYEAASTSRRGFGWNPTRLGANTNLWGTLDLMRARCRDQVRNNPWATSAIDNFEAQVIGRGIRPKWNIEDPILKDKVEKEWNRFANSTKCDYAGKLNFYGLQALAAREIFEAGEVFVRYHVRPESWGLRVPLQLQLIEGEQVPVWRTIIGSAGGEVPEGNAIRTGIEFDPQGRRIAYHMYRENPGETMFFPIEGTQFIRVPARKIEHIYKPLRAGQLRGQPFMASVLGLLYELDQYTDASVVKKKLQACFAAIIEKVDPASDILPPDTNDPTCPVPNPPPQDQGVENTKIEPGTFQYLFPGESVKFPNLPSENDLEVFMRVELHKLAVGMGMTYEQLTGDLKGVNYSSIRAGLLDFRRKCEQFQANIIVRQLCEPIVMRWLEEAVLAGLFVLPGFLDDPQKYADIDWATPGWPWVDPKNDLETNLGAVRAGFTSREAVVAERGEDVATIDAQTVRDNARADGLGLVHDSDPRRILIGRESNPVLPAPPDADPAEVKEEEVTAEGDQ